MFQFPGVPFYTLLIHVWITALQQLCSHIRISTDLSLFATPRSFSQLVTSFFGAIYQGILLCALCSLIFSIDSSPIRRIISFLIPSKNPKTYLQWIVSRVSCVINHSFISFAFCTLFSSLYAVVNLLFLASARVPPKTDSLYILSFRKQ